MGDGEFNAGGGGGAQGRELNTPSHFMLQKRDKLGPAERFTSLTSPCIS